MAVSRPSYISLFRYATPGEIASTLAGCLAATATGKSRSQLGGGHGGGRPPPSGEASRPGARLPPCFEALIANMLHAAIPSSPPGASTPLFAWRFGEMLSAFFAPDAAAQINRACLIILAIGGGVLLTGEELSLPTGAMLAGAGYDAQLLDRSWHDRPPPSSRHDLAPQARCRPPA